jgi:asparagine synthase (glutamine-hydrolysing)
MCGILLTLDGSPESINSIKHRGIEKTVINKENIFLCHHRLPIQTRDGDDWDQPKEISNGIYLMFNGEIFNYDSVSFSSDTEYLCNLFSRYKGGSFEMFCAMFVPHIQTWDGFWAIVIYDSNLGDVITFTDPLGKKPLYYSERGEICSEIKGLAYSQSPIDETYISEIRKWGYNTNEKTPYKDVKRFLPNTIYSYNIKSPEFKLTYSDYYKLWNSPIPELFGKSYEDHMEWLWRKMGESVNNRLISKDYPISLLVSGGLDSSIIAAILETNFKSDVTWYSIENGESEYVNLLAEKYNKRVNFLKYTMDDSKNREIYKYWNETPVDLGSVIPQYYLFEAIKGNSDHRIVLSGDGADELFGGYNRIHEYDSQKSDIFEELSYYHLPRLDKMSMAHTLELRNPFLNLEIVRFAMHLPIEWRKDKKILKDTFSPLLPDEIVNRPKIPLKNPGIKRDKISYRYSAIDLFLS